MLEEEFEMSLKKKSGRVTGIEKVYAEEISMGANTVLRVLGAHFTRYFREEKIPKE